MKGKRKLYDGHGVFLEQSPCKDDFQIDRGSSLIALPPSGRKKKDDGIVRKSSTKRKLAENLPLGFQTGMEKDSNNPLEGRQRKKSKKSGSKSKKDKKDKDKGKRSKRKQRVETVELGQMSHDNLEAIEASDDDFSSLFKASSSKNHRPLSKGSDMSSNSRNENLKVGLDKDGGMKSFGESNQSSCYVSELSQGLQSQPDEVVEPSESHEMFITQRDPHHKPTGISPQFSASRKHTAEDATQRVQQGTKQQPLTLSQVKQLYRSNISKSVMARHRSCPLKLLGSHSSKGKNQEERFFRKLRALQEKRKIASSQPSLEQSTGDTQLSPQGELSDLPQELPTGTQMFAVSCDEAEPVETESQSLIPPMVADDSTSEESEEDTFKEVLAMRQAKKKQRKRHDSSDRIFGLTPLEETQEPEIEDVEILGDESRSDEEKGKQENNCEAKSQITLEKKESDLSQEPAIKDNIEPTEEKDGNVKHSDAQEDDNSFIAPVPPDTAQSPFEGQKGPTDKVDQMNAEESSKLNESSTSLNDIFVLETQSEEVEPEVGGDEATVLPKNDVTLVPDSHDLSESNLPRYHFTSDDDSSNELHDISVSQAVSKFLDTFEDSGHNRPPWELEDGKDCVNGPATKEKKQELKSDTSKGPEQVKLSGNESCGFDKSNSNSSKPLQENADSYSTDGKDKHFNDVNELNESTIHSGPVTKKKTKRMNKEVRKNFFHRLNLSEDGAGSVFAGTDQNTSLMKEGDILPGGAKRMIVRADVHVMDIPTVVEEESNHPSPMTSGNKENFSTVDSSKNKSRGSEEAVCHKEPAEIATVDAADGFTNYDDSSQETCLPEEFENIGSAVRETSSPGSRSPADAGSDVAGSSSQLAGSEVDNSVKGVSVTSLRDCRKGSRVTSKTQTDLTMGDFQNPGFFDICLQLKRMLLEYDNSVITTSGSSSFGSSTSEESGSRDDHCTEDLIVLVRKICDSKVFNKTLSSDEETNERLKRKRKVEMIDKSCQVGSPSKDLENSESELNAEERSPPKESPSENFSDLNVDAVEFGDMVDNPLNSSENCSIDIEGDVSSGKENLASENDVEWKKQKVEEGKRLKAKKRKKNDASENVRQTAKKKKKKLAADDASKERIQDNLEVNTTKTKKKKKAKNGNHETSPGGGTNILEIGEHEVGNNVDESRNVGQTTSEKNVNSETVDIFDIPIESIPGPEEVKRRWEKKQERKIRKLKKKGSSKQKERRKFVDYKELSSSSFDSCQEGKGLEKGSKKKLKVKKRGKECDKTWKPGVLDGGLFADGEEEPDDNKGKGVPGKKKKKVSKHKKKKKTNDSSGDHALQDTFIKEASLLPSPLELLWQTSQNHQT